MPRVHETSFYVAGYAIRTNNTDEMNGHGGIGKLWERFTQQNLVTTIPNRTHQGLIVVYSNYSSDENGEYTYLLGARVASVRDLPANIRYRKVVTGDYSVFTTRVGPRVEVLLEGWKRIWRCRPDELGGPRAFETDFELYDTHSANPMNARIEIHVGLKLRHNSREP